MRIGRFSPALAAVLLAAALPLAAQAPEPAPPQDSRTGPVLHTRANNDAATVPVKVKEVDLLAIVRDKKGNAVTTLAKDDFTLEQDGHPQPISFFARDNDLPLIVGILADTGPGQRKELADERKFSSTFINKLLREGTDKGFVLHFDKQVELLQDITASHDKLARGIDEISVGDSASGSDSRGGRRRDEGDTSRPHYFFGGGLLFDAIYLTANEVLKGQPGRKAVVLFSDGMDRDSHEGVGEAIEAAQRADLMIYTVYVASEREEPQQPQQDRGHRGGGYPGGGYPGGGGGYPRPGGSGRGGQQGETKEAKERARQGLQRIARETGGRYFELNKKFTAEQVYASVENELRHQYRLTYTPAQLTAGYHKLVLKTKNGDYTVQTRDGFYGD